MRIRLVRHGRHVDHRLRCRVVDGGIHGDRRRVQGGESRRRPDVQLRGVVRPRRTDHRGCAGRRVRIGRSCEHGQGDRCRCSVRRTHGLRHQPGRDHRGARQSARHHERRRPRRRRISSSCVCSPEVPCGTYAGEIFDNAGVDGHAGFVRGERQGGRHQGDAGRGRRRHRVRHRRTGRGRRGVGRRDPGRRQRHRRVSDRVAKCPTARLHGRSSTSSLSPAGQTNPRVVTASALRDAPEGRLRGNRRGRRRHASCPGVRPGHRRDCVLRAAVPRSALAGAVGLDARRARGSRSVRTALWLSLRTSLAATVLAVVFGVPLAWLLARVPFRGEAPVRALVPAVDGAATRGRRCRAVLLVRPTRVCSGSTSTDGSTSSCPFTTWGVVVAQTFVSMPFLVITVEAALRQVDRRYEDAARTLGGSRWYVFRRVTLPAIRPALIAGAVLAWAARSASSAPRSPSPATSRHAPRPCRSPSTSRSRPTRRRRSSSAWC